MFGKGRAGGTEMPEQAERQSYSGTPFPHTPRKKANGSGEGTPNGTGHVRVADILVGGRDGRNREITDIFHKRRKYAIYEAGNRVMIQFSDEEREADKQIDLIADLFPMRDKLQYIIAGMRSRQISAQNCYRSQIAEALRLGLEQQMEAARETLQGALDNCMEIRESKGRISYISLALLTASICALVLFFAAYRLAGTSEGLMVLASGGGAIGALLSVAIAIRQRTVAIDGDWFANMLDGALRILIGIISGGVIYLFLASGIVSEIKLGTAADSATLTGQKMNWHIALLIGFAAGFIERLVPELLDKGPNAGSEAKGKTEPKKGQAPAGAGKPINAGEPVGSANGQAQPAG